MHILCVYICTNTYMYLHINTHTHHLCNTHMNQSKRSETCVRGRGSYFLAMGCKCSIASKSCLAIPPLVLPPDGFALPTHSAHHPTPKDLTYAQVCCIQSDMNMHIPQMNLSCGYEKWRGLSFSSLHALLYVFTNLI